MKYKAMNNKRCANGTKLLEHSRGNGPAGAGRLLLFVLGPGAPRLPGVRINAKCGERR